MTRITDKLSRLSSFLDSGKMNVKDESFNDTIVDVINYMVLLSAYVKEKENVNPISDEDSQLYLFEADLSITSPNFQKEIVDIHEC